MKVLSLGPHTHIPAFLPLLKTVNSFGITINCLLMFFLISSTVWCWDRLAKCSDQQTRCHWCAPEMTATTTCWLCPILQFYITMSASPTHLMIYAFFHCFKQSKMFASPTNLHSPSYQGQVSSMCFSQGICLDLAAVQLVAAYQSNGINALG